MPIMLEESEALLIGSFGCCCRPCGAAQGFTGGSARKRLGAFGFLRAALVVRLVSDCSVSKVKRRLLSNKWGAAVENGQ